MQRLRVAHHPPPALRQDVSDPGQLSIDGSKRRPSLPRHAAGEDALLDELHNGRHVHRPSRPKSGPETGIGVGLGGPLHVPEQLHGVGVLPHALVKDACDTVGRPSLSRPHRLGDDLPPFSRLGSDALSEDHGVWVNVSGGEVRVAPKCGGHVRTSRARLAECLNECPIGVRENSSGGIEGG